MWGVPYIYWVNLGVSAALLGVAVYLVVGPTEHRLVRIVRGHRWETFLMLVFPAGTGFLAAAIVWAFVYSPVSVSLWWWFRILEGLGLAALVVAYPFIRRYGHEFLTILWGFTIAMATLGLVLDLAAAARDPGDSFPSPHRALQVPRRLLDHRGGVLLESHRELQALGRAQAGRNVLVRPQGRTHQHGARVPATGSLDGRPGLQYLAILGVPLRE